jgi:hypothetical protein
MVSEWLAEIGVVGMGGGVEGVKGFPQRAATCLNFQGESITALTSIHFYLFHFVTLSSIIIFGLER